MTRDLFVQVSAGMPEHPKVEPLSDNAFRALIEAWCLCRRTGNDGRIPLSTWTKRWKLKARRELVAAGLVHLEDDAAVVHNWLERQPSVAKLEATREARAKAGQKGGARSGQARRGRSTGEANREANHEAIASPEGGHGTITAAQFSADFGSGFDAPETSWNPISSDGVQTLGPAETLGEGEAIASVLLDQTLKQTGSKNQPDKEVEEESSYVGGGRYVTNARDSGDESPPPKFHPGHEGRWDPDCAECVALLDAGIAWRATRIIAAGPATPPPPHCPDHRPGDLVKCHRCGQARRTRQAWDAAQARARAALRTQVVRDAADLRALAIAECPLGCAETGGYLGTALCSHDPDQAATNRRGIAAVRAALAKSRASQADPAHSEEDARVPA